MFNSLTGRTLTANDPPGGARHRRPHSRLGAILTAASALALGFAVMVAPQSAQAVTNLDGQWSIVHGGTGQISLNADGTYTSTCHAYPNYPDAFCPAPSGTFDRNNLSYSYVDFHGADGSTTSYRYSGDSLHPDTIDSTFGSRTYSQLEMKRGTKFVCTNWSGTGTSFTRWAISPLVEYDAATNLLYATGSHDLIGPKNIDTQVNLAETAPQYFQNGTCDDFAPIMHIDSLRDTSVPSSAGVWGPKVTVTIKDNAGALVSGAKVTGQFPDAGYADELASCVTVANGTCKLGNFTLPDSDTSTSFTAYLVERAGSLWDQKSATLRLNNPSAPSPASVLRVDNVTDTSLPAAAPGQWVPWKPQAKVTITDNLGTLISGATVNGTFTEAGINGSCVTVADGTCSIGGTTVVDSLNSSHFTTGSVTKNGMTWDGKTVTIWTYAPYTPMPPTPITHHVANLDDVSAAVSSQKWQPQVQVTIYTSIGLDGDGAIVSGTFSGHKGTVSCTTTAYGTCTLGNFTLKRSTKSTVFTVTNVVRDSTTYAPTDNRDPGGDSNGTTITVTLP